MYGCTGVQVPPLSYILFPCSGLCWHALPFPTTGNYWNHLELLGFSWMCPAPQYLKCMAALVCRSPPLSYILFPCSGLCWHALPFPTTGNYWNHLELLGFSWMCPIPSTWNVWLHWCAGPPPFHTFYSHALGCVGMRCHSPYYWKLLEPPGTYRTLGFSWMCPAPQYLKCMAALVCRSPPLSYILFPCSGLCWHALPFPTSGNYWNHLEPIGP